MKNKALTYVLLLVVGVIWYQVFMRVKSNLDAQPEDGITQNANRPDYRPVDRDTFPLNANYRDPFGSAPVAQVLSEEPVSMPQMPPPRKMEEPWPSIKYYGLVRKTESSNPLGIVSIDGMSLHLRKGDEVYENLQIKTITRDSVIVKYKKQMRTFYRK